MPTLTALTAAQQARYTANLPMLVGPNLLRLAPTIQWRSAGSLSSGTDISSTTFPGSMAGDGRAIEQTLPTSAATSRQLCIDLGAARTFDAAVLFGTFSGTVTATLEAADDAAFSVNLTTLATWNPAQRRNGNYLLGGGPGNSVAARYVRLTLTLASAIMQYVAEIWLGQRLALPHPPDLPVDALNRPQTSKIVEWESDGGNVWAQADLRRGLAGSIHWILDATQDIADANAFLVACGSGGLPCLYVSDPFASPRAAAIVDLEAANLDYSGPVQRIFSVSMRERIPTLSSEGL